MSEAEAKGAADPPRLTVAEVRDALVTDKEEFNKGRWLFDQGVLQGLSRHQSKLFAEADGLHGERHRVSISFAAAQAGVQTPTSPGIKARCTCYAARTRPFCKHAVALLLCWASAPDGFAVAETAPPGAEGEKKKVHRVKATKVDANQVMGAGVARVLALTRELMVAGVTGVDQDRVEQVKLLGESLREHKLRRLSARTVELAALLGQAAEHSAAFQSDAYADHLCDMLLTARKLEKVLGGGEKLEDRYVEELIGKTWTDKDRQPVTGLHLCEYAFSTLTTADGFLVRESRFVDLQTGVHYTERQIIPAFLKKVEPKKSYLGSVLLNASGGIYPGFAPLRLKLGDLGAQAPLGQEALTALCDRALPTVAAALASLQEQRKDLFAPTYLPVALRVDALCAEGDTLRVLDADGNALLLPTQRDPGLSARLSTLLRGGALRVLLGRLDIDDALPTLWPLSAVLEGPLGLELQPLTAPPRDDGTAGRSRRSGSGSDSRGRAAGWAEEAMRLGATPAAVALAEVREGLAQALVEGLGAAAARALEPLVVRLTDLGLGKPAQLLRELLQRPDPAARVDDFVKLYQVLEIALLRLSGAVKIDRQALVPVPTFSSVLVRELVGEKLSPREIMLQRTRGGLGRYEAALHAARFYEGLDAQEILRNVLPGWADGAAIPFIVRAVSRCGADAVAAAERALSSKSYIAKATAVEVLRAVSSGRGETEERALELLKRVHTGDFPRPRSFGRNQQAYWYWEWGGTQPPLQLRAQDALDALALGLGSGRPRVGRAAVDQILERRRRHQAALQGLLQKLNASTADERKDAVRGLAKLGDLEGAAPALRLAAQGDAAKDVQAEALLALGLLGDWEMAEHFIGLLASRATDEDGARSAAYALGYLGDARGIDELLAVFAEGWQPGIIGEALRALGEIALEPLVARLLADPEMLTRQAVRGVLQQLPAQELAEHLCELVLRRAQAGGDVEGQLQQCLKVAAPHKEAPGKLGERLRAALPNLPEAARGALLAVLDGMQQKDKAARPKRGTTMM